MVSFALTKRLGHNPRLKLEMIGALILPMNIILEADGQSDMLSQNSVPQVIYHHIQTCVYNGKYLDDCYPKHIVYLSNV